MAEDDSKKEEMTFAEAHPPALTAGKYRIEIKQAIRVRDEIEKRDVEDAFEKNNTFWVSAPRFSLDPADIYSVYPPPGHEGQYQTVLPHIVFTRKTLPWERTLDGSKPGEKMQTSPWMALLLFDEGEMESHAIKIQTAQLKDLISPPGGIQGPKIQLEPWETPEDPCNVIDVPATLFNEIVPEKDELGYLAHARQVSMDDKEIPGMVAEGWFSVILGNRLPGENRRNTVFLVSLEGFEDLLHVSNPQIDGQNRVRLSVLTQWSFTAKGPTFLNLMDHLKEGAEQLRILSNQNVGNETVEKAMALGYTALNHTTRLGERMVSWYRGPLVPLSLAKEPYNYIYDSADASLRYDAETGIFDVSYAAAWQLGRLLSLQKSEFAQELYRWKSKYMHEQTLVVAEKLLQKEYGEKLYLKDMEEPLQDDLMTNLMMELWTSFTEP
jgi:hypothetical protein